MDDMLDKQGMDRDIAFYAPVIVILSKDWYNAPIPLQVLFLELSFFGLLLCLYLI